MEGQFGPKHSHPALDLVLLETANQDTHSSSETETAHTRVWCWGTPAPKVSCTQDTPTCVQSPESKGSEWDSAHVFLAELKSGSVATGSCAYQQSADFCYHTPKSSGTFKARDLILTSEILCVYKRTQPRHAYHLALSTLTLNNLVFKRQKRAQVPIPL